MQIMSKPHLDISTRAVVPNMHRTVPDIFSYEKRNEMPNLNDLEAEYLAFRRNIEVVKGHYNV